MSQSVYKSFVGDKNCDQAYRVCLMIRWKSSLEKIQVCKCVVKKVKGNFSDFPLNSMGA